MGKIVTVTVPMPTGGMTNDPRDTRPGVCRVCTNFDINTDERRAIPYYDSEDGDANAATSQKQNFCVALRTGTTYSLYALGVVSGQNFAEINYKDLTTGAAHDLDDNAWQAPSNNASAASATNFELFVYYKKVGLIFGAKAGTNIWAFSPSGSAFAENSHSLAYTNIAQGLVHSQDDILYVPYDNKIAKNDNGSWTDAALTIPSEFYIASICEYGANLAIAAAPLSGVGKSRVYIWDRSTTLTTIAANIDWGQGVIKVLEELEGYLIGISVVSDSTRVTKRVVLKQYIGAAGARKITQFSASSGTTTLFIAKQKIDNRVFFMMNCTINGAIREGVWSIGHQGGGRFAVAHERTPNNDTALGNGILKNFFSVGDYLFISYTNNATANALSKTNDSAAYTATAIIETVINPNMPPEDRHKKKILISTGATYDPLPAAASIVVKGKVNGASSYTSIFTETTDNTIKTEPVQVPSAGTYLDTGEEFEFQLNDTGGGVPTAIIYKYEVMEGND